MNIVILKSRTRISCPVAHEWLNPSFKMKRSTSITKSRESDRLRHLFAHCTESLNYQVLHKMAENFAYFGETLINQNVGCCGMAGTFGHETAHEMSKAIYAQSWQVKIADKPLNLPSDWLLLPLTSQTYDASGA